MGVSVKTDGLYECVSEIQKSRKAITEIMRKMKNCRIPFDKYNSNSDMLKSMTIDIIEYLVLIQNMLQNNAQYVKKKADDFEVAEQNNQSSVAGLGSIQTITASYDGTTTSTNQAQTGSGTTINPDNEEISPRPPLDVEIEDQEQTDNIGDAISVDVEAVIALIFGENVEIPDNVKQTVATAIGHINTTKILDGLDEEYANKIRAEIVQDYLDGKLKLEGITAEELKEYINSDPSIKILLETAIAIKSFEKLIESGVITEEKIKTSIEEKIVIQSDEEFEKMYIENGGTEANVKNVKSFYDTKTEKMYIRNTADSTVIAFAITTVMGNIVVHDEETGQDFYAKTQVNLNKESDVNISGQNTNTSTTQTEKLEKEAEINLSGEGTNSSISNNEVIGNKDVTTEIPKDDKTANATNIGNITSN